MAEILTSTSSPSASSSSRRPTRSIRCEGAGEMVRQRPCPDRRRFPCRAGRDRRPGRRQRRRQVDADQDPVGRRTSQTSGRIFFAGKEVRLTSPKVSMHLGIETIYQYTAMVPQMSIARNIFIGREPLSGAPASAASASWTRSHGRARHQVADQYRPDPALAEHHGRGAVRRPAPGGRHRPRDVFQVEAPDPRRADQPPLGQGDQQGARLRRLAQGAGHRLDLHQPQPPPHLPDRRPHRGDGARREDRRHPEDRHHDRRATELIV